MILIKDISVLTMEGESSFLDKANILIDGEKIVKISQDPIDLEGKEVKAINGEGKVAMPGLINTHTHMGMCLFRNYGNDLALTDWLEKAIYPLEAKLETEDIYYGAMLNMAEMMRFGATRFVDMYMFEDEIARACEDIGMGGVLANGFVDFDDVEKKIEKIKENVSKYKGSSLIDFAIAPHAIYTVCGDNYERLATLSEDLDTLMHTHLSETREEVETAFDKYGKSPVAYMKDLGVFNRPTIAAHCVHVSDEDIEILAEEGVFVSHNPSSNLKLASGFAPIKKMMDRKVVVSLGTDGSASNNSLNMVEEMHLASLLAKGVSGDPKALGAYESLKMATVNGAKAIRREDLGMVKEGMTADIAIFDLDGVHMTPMNDPEASLVYSLQGSDCNDLIINGDLVMEDKKIISIDVDALKEEVRARSKRLING